MKSIQPKTKQGEINLLAQQNQVFLINAYQSLKAVLNTNDSILISNNANYVPLTVNNLIDTNAIANHPMLQSLYQKMLIAEQTKKVEKGTRFTRF